MKKLKLSALQFGAKEVLSREQLKNVMGGNMPQDGCNVKADCTGCKPRKCSGNISCSGSNDVGVTCDGVEIKCPKYPEAGCL